MNKSTMNHLNKDVANEDIGINAMRNILLSRTSQRLKEREKGGKENEKEDKTSFWSSIFWSFDDFLVLHVVSRVVESRADNFKEYSLCSQRHN